MVYQLLLLYTLIVACSSTPNSNDLHETVCQGTNSRMSVPANRFAHYQNLKKRYANCTYVDGNLELTWLLDQDSDLTFLEQIREVTGYVLIFHVDVPKVVLPKLLVIQGQTHFNLQGNQFALLASLSRMETLELPALREIFAGSVGMLNNFNLCFVKTINWDEIMSDVNGKYIYVYNYSQAERECPDCDESCKVGCWGEGSQNCQNLSKNNCSPQCKQGRCYGTEPRQCCHPACAGGCTGPKNSECLACKHYNDDGECKDQCPSPVIYNSSTFQLEENPYGKYAYGGVCVETCPQGLFRDSETATCVRQCPPGKEQSKEGKCVPCSGPCKKTCPGALIHSGNIDSFRNCTIIEGSLELYETSFNGFQEVHPNYTFGERYKPMDPSELEVFSTLKEVTGYIKIQATHPNFTNLIFLRNLETIGGNSVTELGLALFISKTSLRSLQLRSLKIIKSGDVYIADNPELCFVSTINWMKFTSLNHEAQILNNESGEQCRKKSQVCSTQCSDDGCWGHDSRDCLTCANFSLNDDCVSSCDANAGVYQDSPGICMHCHEQCLGTCNGAGADQCKACTHFRDGPFCVESCPRSKYSLAGGDCRPCHENCFEGCTGPANTIGNSGCNNCSRAIVDSNDQILECIGKDEDCPAGYYSESAISKPGMSPGLTSVCQKCHPRCKKCTAYGFHSTVCQECTFFKRGEQCGGEGECTPDEFFLDNQNQECLPCANECHGCDGPTAYDCLACRFCPNPVNAESQNSNGSVTCSTTCPKEDLRSPVSEETVTEKFPHWGRVILEYTTTTTVRVYSILK